jgi:hypothetical protein
VISGEVEAKDLDGWQDQQDDAERDEAQPDAFVAENGGDT